MDKGEFLKNKLELNFYCSIFIVIVYSLLIKLSPFIFSILNFFPLLFVGLLLNFSSLIICFLSSIIILFLSFNFLIDNSNLNTNFLISHIIFSFGFSLFFLGLLKFKRKTEDDLGNVLSVFLLISSSILIYVFVFLISDQLKLFFSEIKIQYYSILQKSNIENQKSVDELFTLFFNIFPSLNFLFFFFIMLFNLFLAQSLVRVSKLSKITLINYNKFEISNWYLYLFLLSNLGILFSINQVNIFFINFSISLSLIFILKGILISKQAIKKNKQPNFLKYFILFFLFFFLGYFLLLYFFFIGIVDKIKKIYYKK